MIESPVLQAFLSEGIRESRQRDIVKILAIRFGTDAKGLATVLKSVRAEERLEKLFDLAVICPSLDAFRAGLAKDLETD